MSRHRLLCLVFALIAAACTDGPASAFRDVTETHVPAAPELHALDAVMVDVDGDGDRDVVLAVEGDVNRLYVNDGSGKLTWAEGVFGSPPHDNEHVRAADFDGDGNIDVLFVAEDDQQHSLFLGNGDGSFVDESIRLPSTSEGNGLAVGDVDSDGDPDVVIGNSGATGQELLWLNEPDSPALFAGVTATHLPRVIDSTQDVTLADVDGDSDLDLIVGNEVPPSRLLANDGSGRFSDVSQWLDLRVEMETRQVLAFDATGDGQLDLVLCNITSNNVGVVKDPQTRLLVNDGTGRFRDETAARMPTNTFSTYACAHVDYDGDGRQDLVLSALAIPGFEPLQVRLYANAGRGNFLDVTDEAIPSTAVGRNWGIAVGDLDGDGADDLFIGGWGTQARLLLGAP